MKESEIVIVTDSDFSQRITKKYQKGRRSPLKFPLMIFLDKMRNFLSHGMKIDLLLRFYLTRQYQKFSIFLNELLHPIFSVPVNKHVSSQILYYGNNVEFFNPAAGEITSNIKSVFAKHLTENKNLSNHNFQIIQKLIHNISTSFQEQNINSKNISRTNLLRSIYYTSDISVFLKKILHPSYSLPFNKQVSNQILYYRNNILILDPIAWKMTDIVKSLYANQLIKNKNISISSSIPDIILRKGKTDEFSVSNISHANYLQILNPAFIMLKSKIGSDHPEKEVVYKFSFHSIYEQTSPTILMRWQNGKPINTYNQTGVLDVHYPDIKLYDSNNYNLQIPHSIIIKSNKAQKIDNSFIQREKIRRYLSTFIQTSPEIISEQRFRSVSEHTLILTNILAPDYYQSVNDLSAQTIHISGNSMRISFAGPSITKRQNYLKNIFLYSPKSSGIHIYEFMTNRIQLTGNNAFFNNLSRNYLTFSGQLIKNSMNKGHEVQFLSLPQKELITRSDNFYFQNVPDIHNAIEKFEKIGAEIKETVTRSLSARSPEVQQQIELHHLSDKVYQMIDRRLMIEKERRGYL